MNLLRMFQTLVFACVLASQQAQSDVIELFPGNSFEAAVESLNPGDTLIVHEGTYEDTGRISIGVGGTVAQPVEIKGADGEAKPFITRSAGSQAQNTINIEGATYVTIRGLEISGNGDAINMSGNPSFITLEDLFIHDIDVGINFRSDMHHIVVRRNHITRTAGTGEGMYVGCNFASCIVSDSIIENNWIHDTLSATQGDGIEIKRGSHSNVIRDNVIYDTNFPCILVYGTEGQSRNIIEGNVVWNCGDSGIQAAADAVIRNNIILESPGNGLNSQPHQGVTPGNLEFVHNTLIGGSPCVRINSWDGRPGLVFANNAIYCASGSFVVGGLSGVTVSGNVFEPATSAFPSGGYTTGRSESADFIDFGSKDVWPTSDSPLIGAADSTHAVAVDFNGAARSGTNAGAYEWTQNTNPGWQIGPGFKNGSSGAPGNPTVSLNANPTTVSPQDSTTLSWTTTNADNCAASGDWAGNKPTAGSETVGPLTSDSDFQLQCTNASGGSQMAQISVTVDTSGGGSSGGSSDSGGGALGWPLVVVAALLRRRLAQRRALPGGGWLRKPIGLSVRP